MQKIKTFSIIFGLLGSLFVLNVASAQDDTEFEPFFQTDFTILTGDLQRPHGIYWHEGFLYTGCVGDWTLYRLHDTTGETVTYVNGIKDAPTLYVERNEDIAGEPITVWVVDFQDSKFIRVVERQGGEVIRDGLASPWGIAASATDNTFFISEWGSDNIINMTRDGEISVVTANMADPAGLVATEERLYVVNNGSAARSVEWIDLTEGASTQPQPLISGLQNATNIVLADDGQLYIAYALGTRGVIGRVDPQACIDAGGCANVDVERVIWTDLAAPLAGLTITPDMRLYVHTRYGTEIYWLNLLDEKTE